MYLCVCVCGGGDVLSLPLSALWWWTRIKGREGGWLLMQTFQEGEICQQFHSKILWGEVLELAWTSPHPALPSNPKYFLNVKLCLQHTQLKFRAGHTDPQPLHCYVETRGHHLPGAEGGGGRGSFRENGSVWRAAQCSSPPPSVEACGIVFQTMSRSDCHRPRALFTRVHVAVCVAGTFSCTYSIESFQTGFPMCCSSSFIPLSPELKMQRSIFFLPPTNCRGLYYCLVELVRYTRLLKTSPSSLVDGCQDGRNKGGFQWEKINCTASRSTGDKIQKNRRLPQAGWLGICVYMDVLRINIYTPLCRNENERGQARQTLTEREQV